MIPKKGKCDSCTEKEYAVNRPVEVGGVNFDDGTISENETLTLDLCVTLDCAECGAEIGRMRFQVDGIAIPKDVEIEWDNE